MTSARFIIGDVREVLSTLPDRSVDLILTSPPFLALRSYLPPDHPDKHLEVGIEATPADFLDVLLDLTEEWARVLAPHGSIVVELGDTYAGSGGAGGDYNPGGRRVGQASFDGASRRERASTHKYAGEWANPGYGDGFKGGNPGGRGWPLSKSLCGIPTLYTWSLAYGRNLLRPERTTDPWRIRNLGTWLRPNPPVGALSDKMRPASSFITIATKARNRWFDLDAVRTPSDKPVRTTKVGKASASKGVSGGDSGNPDKPRPSHNPAGSPPLDWHSDLDPDGYLHLILATEAYKGSHYATFPRRLPEKFVQLMCPLRVCTVCGEPSRRIVEKSERYEEARRVANGLTPSDWDQNVGNRSQGLPSNMGRQKLADGSQFTAAEYVTLGWTDCGHNAWRNGVVLDPFAGSGTTLAVATGHGRDAIGIDIDERNADLALERIGPLLLTVERHRREDAA